MALPAPQRRNEGMTAWHYFYLAGMAVSVFAAIMLLRDLYISGRSGTVVAERTLRTFGSREWKSFDLELDPSMNPLRFSVTARIDTSAIDTQESFHGRLMLQGREAASHSVSYDRNSKSEVPAASYLSVSSPGRYTYVPNASGRAWWVTAANVEVKRNVHVPGFWRIVGWIALFFGAAALAEMLGDRPPFMVRAAEDAKERERLGL